jgi:CheY-like chemotaxis protein
MGPAVAADGSDLVVLLVTDDGDLRTAAARTPSSEGCSIVTAAHAGHALLACLAGLPVDVLVTELAMDDMSGPQLAGRMRRLRPDLPVVYLAPAGAPASDSVLARPFTREDLLDRIRASAAFALASGTARRLSGC